MILIYRTPAVIPPEVRAAFEACGIRLRPGDKIGHKLGKRPFAMRELDFDLTPLLPFFDLESIDGEAPSASPRPQSPLGPASPLRLVRRDQSQQAG